MSYDDTDPIDDAQPSATERQLRRLVVPEPAAYAPISASTSSTNPTSTCCGEASHEHHPHRRRR
ncbi:hypothetical protein [Nocardioides rubriscoriae]|uniref:hypothetical protein n=1 Tax=Nocardioides rubriscoriae TaxID=642762 RepID=UPI0014794348|nr:hypothetical protein [Nocardioides rubriscoriae]